MKSFIPYSLLLAAAACGVAVGQTTAYTTPVGYSTQTLLASKFNLIGLDLHKPISVTGTLTAVSGAVLTDTSVTNFATALTASRTYILEMVTGTAAGVSQEFVTVSGSTLTLPSSVTGVAVGDQYQIRVAPTLEDIFGTTTSVLTKGATAALADNIYLPNGSGGYNVYWQNTAGSFRNFVGGTAAANVPVVYMDGLLVKKGATAGSLVLSGEIKKISSTNTIVKGFNPLGTGYPAGSTLQNIGLTGIQKGATAALSDKIHIPNGSGGYNIYWMNSASSWRNFVGGTAATAPTALTPGFFIEKVATGTVAIKQTAPTEYSSL